MAREVFAWGYTGWRSQHHPDGYEISATVDGRDCWTVHATPEAADAAFSRVARRAWLRRRWRVLRRLPPRATPAGGRDDYVEFQPVRIAIRIARNLFSRPKRNFR